MKGSVSIVEFLRKSSAAIHGSRDKVIDHGNGSRQYFEKTGRHMPNPCSIEVERGIKISNVYWHDYTFSKRIWLIRKDLCRLGVATWSVL